MSFSDLTVSPYPDHYDIFLRTDPDLASTASFTNLHSFFASELSSIFQCKCDNESNLPFREEIKNTEIGHLVEHVLLEYLCQEKIKLGHALAQYSGRTYWDWRTNPPGTFRIRIKISSAEDDLFMKALRNTLALFARLPQPKAAPLSGTA